MRSDIVAVRGKGNAPKRAQNGASGLPKHHRGGGSSLYVENGMTAKPRTSGCWKRDGNLCKRGGWRDHLIHN